MAQFLLLYSIHGDDVIHVNLDHLESYTLKRGHVWIGLASGKQVEIREDLATLYRLILFAQGHPGVSFIDEGVVDFAEDNNSLRQ